MPASNGAAPLISIITACFNAAEFIEDTIRSVLGQTYPHLEYLIIDGGSTDGTVEIIRRYVPRLAYWHSRPDRGLAHAFNLGLAQARGEWVLFLNADDYLTDAAVIADMVPHLHTHRDADVVYGRIALIARDGRDAGHPTDLRGGPWRWQQYRFICTIPHQGAFTRAGPRLKAVFVPRLVSHMRDGGVSQDVPNILREWRQAQLVNRAAPVWLIWANYLSRAAWNRWKSRGSRGAR
jgi:glycosyltransferase involved in cell wall biosynthesis